MEIINVIYNDKFLTEYIELCGLEWENDKYIDGLDYITRKKEKIRNGDKVISVLGLVDNDILVGFISLFKYDGDYKRNLEPWYATMYVKEEYRGKGYSRILNDAILKEVLNLGYNRVYLKTELDDYYEKFGAKYIEKLNEKEKLYYFDLRD